MKQPMTIGVEPSEIERLKEVVETLMDTFPNNEDMEHYLAPLNDLIQRWENKWAYRQRYFNDLMQ